MKVTTETRVRPESDSRPSVISFGKESVPISPLDELIRKGAQQMLQVAIEAEVQEFLAQHSQRVDDQGRRQVVRNGYLPSREIQTGAGSLQVQQARVRDKSSDKSERVVFASKILPPYLRRSKSLDELIPFLYLKGISTADMGDALTALLGDDAPNLGANVVVRLKEKWKQEYEEFHRQDFSQKEYVYLWADGIHVNVRLETDGNERQCMLVLMGADREGKKELIAVYDGVRESEQSWYELLVDLKQRGLKMSPRLAIGDGALGFWAALRKTFGETREQRCWVHKTANVLNKLPNSVQPKAKADLHEIWMAETREAAEKAFDTFLEKYELKYRNACECLKKDRDVLLTFYDFPAEHWAHLRTTNPIESTFATIRLRHRRTKGSGTRDASLAMMFKLAKTAEKKWRRLNGHQKIIPLLQGIKFTNGVIQEAA